MNLTRREGAVREICADMTSAFQGFLGVQACTL